MFVSLASVLLLVGIFKADFTSLADAQEKPGPAKSARGGTLAKTAHLDRRSE
jgi:hypothetical protein